MTGNEVRNILIDKGFKLNEIADKLGVSAQTFNSRLNAKNFKKEYLIEISQMLDISFGNTESDDNIYLSIIKSQQETIKILSESIKSLSLK